MNATTDTRNGYLAASTAFVLWGVYPLYWKFLGHVPALEIMLHRVVWCFVSVALVLAVFKGWQWWRPLVRQPSLMWKLAASGSLISLNWFVYIWAVNAGHVVETSLGYYINPLVNVAMGMVLLGERLRPVQMIAVGIAAIGVVYLTFMNGRFPWIALLLALTFAGYGFIRKTTDVDSISGLALEGAVMLPWVLIGIAVLHGLGMATFSTLDFGSQALILASGAITAVPLVLFAYGARRIPYSTVGMLQYIGPSLQLALAIWVFKEPFNRNLLIGFACTWLALAIYTGDGIQRMSRARAARRQAL